MKIQLFVVAFTAVLFTITTMAQPFNGDDIPDPVIQKPLKTFEVNGISFDMVYVKGGTFTMGTVAKQGSDAEDDEKLAHKVTLPDYYIGKHQVTQRLWMAVMGGENPSRHQGNDYPVECVNWSDIQEFIVKLNSLTGKTFTLPTEAQWEFAARGGNKSKDYKYSGSNNLDDVGWYMGNSNRKIHAVGQKLPNELGLYDMSGNVYEWCRVWNENHDGAFFGFYNILRGGAFWDGELNCCVVDRSGISADGRYCDSGFRLALVP